jgi:polyisoprenoid-binding protein YceI
MLPDISRTRVRFHHTTGGSPVPVAQQPLTGLFVADPVHSSFGFAVRHMGLSTFRGTFDQVEARLDATGEEPVLEGVAAVEGISIRTPEQFRAHVLGEEFFDAERHPDVRFRSTRVQLADGGEATVEGELTIRGTSRPLVAHGTWTPAITDPYGSTRSALELSAVVDRFDFGMLWDTPLPGGGSALAREVTLTIHLELVAQGQEA